MAQINREGMVRFGDASINICEEPGRTSTAQWKEFEKGFRRDVFKRVIQQLNRLGWTVSEWDEAEQYRCIAHNHRSCKKGDLHGLLDLSGRCLKFKMWQSVANITREDGNGKYEFDKEAKMPYLIRLTMEHTRRHLRDYLCNIFSGYKFETERSDGRQNKRGFGYLTAVEWVQGCYETSWHFKGDLSKYEISPGQRKSADGHQLEHGQRVWFYDRKGRCSTGIAMYNINNMWWVITGKYDVTNEACFYLYTKCPANPRIKNNTRLRRGRLEKELSKAIKQMNFQRAGLLKKLLFGDQVLYHLVSDSDGLYWRPNYSGYTSDSNDAGKYTAEEVETYRGRSGVKVVPVYAETA